MAIGFAVGDSSLVYASKLTNKWVQDWAGGNDYAYTSVVADNRYVTNFFTDEGTVILSGTAQSTTTIAQLEKWTS
jgi:hypothetical protein